MVQQTTEEMWEAVVSEPMPSPLQTAPPDELNRAVQLWRDVLVASCRAHEAKPEEEEYHQRHTLAINAHALMGVLLRRLPRALQGSTEGGPVPLKQLLRGRLRRAELGTDEDWRTILVEFLVEKELVKNKPEMEAEGSPDVKRGRKAVASVHGDCVKRSVQDLADTGPIAMTEEVRNALLDLVAAPVGEDEVRVTRAEAARLLEQARRTAQPPGKKALKQRICGPTFRAGAGPGPSAIRNAHILALARQPGGVDAIRAFARV